MIETQAKAVQYIMHVVIYILHRSRPFRQPRLQCVPHLRDELHGGRRTAQNFLTYVGQLCGRHDLIEVLFSDSTAPWEQAPYFARREGPLTVKAANLNLSRNVTLVSYLQVSTHFTFAARTTGHIASGICYIQHNTPPDETVFFLREKGRGLF
jgi:hypothetical protein